MDENPELNPDPVAKAKRSISAKDKASTRRTTSGFEAHSFRDLLRELATLTKNSIRIQGSGRSFSRLTQATPLQARAFELLGFSANGL